MITEFAVQTFILCAYLGFFTLAAFLGVLIYFKSTAIFKRRRSSGGKK